MKCPLCQSEGINSNATVCPHCTRRLKGLDEWEKSKRNDKTTNNLLLIAAIVIIGAAFYYENGVALFSGLISMFSKELSTIAPGWFSN